MSNLFCDFDPLRSHTTLPDIKSGEQEEPSSANLKQVSVTTDAGGKPNASTVVPLHCHCTVPFEGEIARLAKTANAFMQQVTLELECDAEISPLEATKLVNDNIKSRIPSWLNRIALLPTQLHFRAIRGFHLWLWDTCQADTLLRCRAKRRLQKLLQQQTARQYRKHIREADITSLMIDMGYNSSSIRRYQERVRLRKEQLATAILQRFGLSKHSATQYLASPRETPLDEGTLLAEEIIEIEHNPALHPTASRVQFHNGEKPQRRIINELDEILSLRQQATLRLRKLGWNKIQVTNWLRNCMIHELRSAALTSAPIKSAPGEDHVLTLLFGVPVGKPQAESQGKHPLKTREGRDSDFSQGLPFELRESTPPVVAPPITCLNPVP